MRKMLFAFVSIMIVLSTSLHAEVPTKESVTKLYVATFNRAPDAAGLNYWLNDSGLQLEQIAQSFFDQPETQAAYPQGSTNTEFVAAVYDNLFNREPDQAGLDYWVGELNAGRVEKSVFILAVMNGAQDTVEFGNDATILANKETVGLAFVDAGLDDVEFAKDIMLGVTDTLASVEEAKYKIEIYNAEEFELLKDVNGTVNIGENAKQVSYYKISLSSNNGLEKYALYMNLYEGTVKKDNVDMTIELRDDSGMEIKMFSSADMDEADANIYEQFDIVNDGDYYLILSRASGYAAKYGFSIHPSNDNGLVHTAEGELNDFKSMATPLTLEEAQNDVTGTLNYDRVVDSSIKNTDQYDYYEIDFDQTGIFTFYMNLYDGTIASQYYNSRAGDVTVELKDEDDQTIKSFETVRSLVGTRVYEQFIIPSEGKYYLSFKRRASEEHVSNGTIFALVAKYGFSIQPSNDNGLVHTAEGEMNDFKSMATQLTLSEAQNDVTGTLNYDRVVDSSIKNTDQYDYYEIDFDQTGIFTFYMNLYDGTIASRYYNSRGGDVTVELKDSYDRVVKSFTTVRSLVGTRVYEQFTIPSEGKYYLSFKRIYGENDSNNNFYALVAKYGFSVQPSNDNGLVHTAEGELNDFKSMATQLTLSAMNVEMMGTLNYDRVVDSSIKNTDQYDYYEIDFDQTGIFTFYMNLYDGTIASRYYNSRAGDVTVELKDSYDRVVKSFTTVRSQVGTQVAEEFTIPSTGKYYLRLTRKYGENDSNNNFYALVAKYGIKITQP